MWTKPRRHADWISVRRMYRADREVQVEAVAARMPFRHPHVGQRLARPAHPAEIGRTLQRLVGPASRRNSLSRHTSACQAGSDGCWRSSVVPWSLRGAQPRLCAFRITPANTSGTSGNDETPASLCCSWVQIHDPLRLHEWFPHHDPHPDSRVCRTANCDLLRGTPGLRIETYVEDQLIAQVAARRWPVARTKFGFCECSSVSSTAIAWIRPQPGWGADPRGITPMQFRFCRVGVC